MATSQTVVATFNLVQTATVTVNKSGSGTGMVVSSPAGINCGPDCNQSYALGTVVTLTANPSGNSDFGRWVSGPCTGTATSCTFTVTATTTVGARFDREND
jgi:hypothetical protein